jgi:DNA-binding NarL/FixJ family response regulator
MAQIADPSFVTELLQEGEIGQASRVALAHRYPAGEHEEEKLQAALLGALNGDYRLAATLTPSLKDESSEAVALRRAIEALLLARSGQVCEACSLLREASAALASIRRDALAIAFSSGTAWFEYLSGDFPASVATYERALDTCLEAGMPQWYGIMSVRVARVALTSGDIATAVRWLSNCMMRRSVCTVDSVRCAAGITLGAIIEDRTMLKPFADFRSVRSAFAAGHFHEAYAMVSALTAAWRNGLTDLQIEPLMALALRALADPLDAFDVLLDIAAHGYVADAFEAVALLESAVRSKEQRLAHACVQLANVYAHLRKQNYALAAQHAAEAARAFKTINAAPFLKRALDALVRVGGNDWKPVDRCHRLTQRQRQVLAMLRAGHTNKEIASALAIGEHTVERNVSVILDELNLRSRWQLLD